MRNLVNYKYTVSCADRHRHVEPGEIRILITLCSCAIRHSYAESSELQIGLRLAYMVNCADSSLFAGHTAADWHSNFKAFKINLK